MSKYLEKLAVKKPAKPFQEVNVERFVKFTPQHTKFDPSILKRLQSIVATMPNISNEKEIEEKIMEKVKANKTQRILLTSEDDEIRLASDDHDEEDDDDTEENDDDTEENDDDTKEDDHDTKEDDDKEEALSLRSRENLKTLIKSMQLTNNGDKPSSPVHLKVKKYIMNNRETFIGFIHSLFEPYKKELRKSNEQVTCETIDNDSTNISLMIHQQIVQDYLNLYTPYRGLLLYNDGLNNCTSIAVAEGLKEAKKVIVLTTSVLESNYIEQLKTCTDSLFKKNQHWEWISIRKRPEALHTLSTVLNVTEEFLSKQGGAFFVNSTRQSNYDTLDETEKEKLDEQLNKMIMQKYDFIDYENLSEQKISNKTHNHSANMFDHAIIVIDQADKFIGRIAEKLKGKNKDNTTEDDDLSVKLYEMLMKAIDVRIILLTSYPIVRHPFEVGIIFNILRGYIVTWKFKLDFSKRKSNVDVNSFLSKLKTLDYISYSASNKELTVTRNPFGFESVINKQAKYKGVERTDQYPSNDKFLKELKELLKEEGISVENTTTKYFKAFPDDPQEFEAMFIDTNTMTLKNADSFKRRMLGLSSYFQSAHESLLPSFEKNVEKDYHIVHVPMSEEQFKIYKDEREFEMKREDTHMQMDLPSSYRIATRLICNYAIPNRPKPNADWDPDQVKEYEDQEKQHQENEVEMDLLNANEMEDADKEIERKLQQAERKEEETKIESEIQNQPAGVDEIIKVATQSDSKVEDNEYTRNMRKMLKTMKHNPDKFFSKKGLKQYSPKFLKILNNIQKEKYKGLHMVYSEFLHMEGIELFSLVLQANGFAQFKVKKNHSGVWKIDIAHEERGKPMYALYTGAEDREEKELIRKVFNGEWNDKGFPKNIREELERMHPDNTEGEVIKVILITASGSEDLRLRNTRYVHLMDPYWHPVRSEKAISYVRHMCSHQYLEPTMRTVDVFLYLMTFASEDNTVIEDKSKWTKRSITTDEYLFELSEERARLNKQITDAINQSAMDCYIFSDSPAKCVQFGSPSVDKFAFVPTGEDSKELQMNLIKDENGQEYLAQEIGNNGFQLYSVDNKEMNGKLYLFANKDGVFAYKILLTSQ